MEEKVHIEWKITCAFQETKDYHEVVIWERQYDPSGAAPWARLAVGGFWEAETFGHHRRKIAETVKKLLH